jgi:hypothetical protein
MNKWGQGWNIEEEVFEIRTTETIKTRWQVLNWELLAQDIAKWRPFINTGTTVRFT